MSRPWPVELRLNRTQDVLTVSFDDGVVCALEAEYLRVMTGSAAERGHGSGPRPAIPGKQAVKITAVNPVGRYAARLVFDDGHDTGLYSWDLRRQLNDDRERLWGDYLAGLSKAGLSRADG